MAVQELSSFDPMCVAIQTIRCVGLKCGEPCVDCLWAPSPLCALSAAQLCTCGVLHAATKRAGEWQVIHPWCWLRLEPLIS